MIPKLCEDEKLVISNLLDVIEKDYPGYRQSQDKAAFDYEMNFIRELGEMIDSQQISFNNAGKVYREMLRTNLRVLCRNSGVFS